MNSNMKTNTQEFFAATTAAIPSKKRVCFKLESFLNTNILAPTQSSDPVVIPSFTYRQVKILAELLSYSEFLASNVTHVTDVMAAADLMFMFLSDAVNGASEYQILSAYFQTYILTVEGENTIFLIFLVFQQLKL
jgi:hypothetical protein